MHRNPYFSLMPRGRSHFRDTVRSSSVQPVLALYPRRGRPCGDGDLRLRAAFRSSTVLLGENKSLFLAALDIALGNACAREEVVLGEAAIPRRPSPA
jgi:hypothetical protein